MDLISNIAVLLIFAYFIWFVGGTIVKYAIFLPYQNNLSTLLLEKFSRRYRESMDVYRTLLSKKELSSTKTDIDLKLFEELRKGNLWKSTEDEIIEWSLIFRKPEEAAKSFDPELPVSFPSPIIHFVYKHPLLSHDYIVLAFFNVKDVIYLQHMAVWYLNRNNKYTETIMEKKFLPPPTAERGHYRVVLPPVEPVLV